MDSNCGKKLRSIKRLKALAFNLEHSNGNKLLHKFVLDNSYPNNMCCDSYINAVLLSMSGSSVNALNYEGYSALHLTVIKNNLLMVKKLLSCLENIDINNTATVYGTPLHIAVNKRNFDIAKFLVSSGADLNAKNSFNYTPLHLAVNNNNFDIVKFLLSSGADINAKNEIDVTPLHLAVLAGNFDCVKFLVSSGADLNAKTSMDNTPLHWAVGESNFDIVKFLVSSGADLNAEDIHNRTPPHLAEEMKRLEIVEFFSKFCSK